MYFISDYVYLLDLSKLNLKSISLADYETSNENYIKNTINELKNNYNLNVYVSNNALDFPDFTAEGINETFLIKTSLENLTSIFKKFDKDFYQTFYLDGYKGLNIYLTGNLQPKNLEEQIANPAAYSLKYNHNFVIVIDITKSNLKRNACHELFHNVEFTLTKYQAFGDWNSFNPSDFSYNNSYTKDYLYDYTINEQNLNNIYFIDKYSHTYPEEDRARIFENICAFNYSPLNNFPNLLKKAHYLQNEVLNYYPNLQNIFTSLL